MQRLAALALGLTLAACSGASERAADLASPGDLALTATQVGVGATHGSIEVSYTLQASGQGSDKIGAVAITDGAGTIEIDGKVRQAFTHEQQAWDIYNLTLYQTIAVDETSWFVLWLYCNDQNQLENIYYEGSDGTPMQYEAASGSCVGTKTASSIAVELPATNLDVDLVHGFVASAPGLSVVDSQPGTLTIGGKVNTLLPFEVVDCLDCETNGWYELHSIAADRTTGVATFLIFYFYPNQPTSIYATYAMSLPTLVDPIGSITLTGTWSYVPPALRRTPAPTSKRVPWLWRRP